MSVVEHQVEWVASTVEHGVDEAAARRTLRAQIAHLDRELVTTATASFPALAMPVRPAHRAAPRLLTLGELEAVRDELTGRLQELTVQRRAHADSQAAARGLLERMLLAPGKHRWVRVTNADLGEPGCKSYHAVPRVGVIGMLAGWWHVKVSSGCPLAWGMSC
jgi:hypothetical protein